MTLLKNKSVGSEKNKPWKEGGETESIVPCPKDCKQCIPYQKKKLVISL